MVGRAATIRYTDSVFSVILYLCESTTHSRVRDLVGLLVHGNVKVHPDQNLFALELEVGNSELGSERHCCSD